MRLRVEEEEKEEKRACPGTWIAGYHLLSHLHDVLIVLAGDRSLAHWSIHGALYKFKKKNLCAMYDAGGFPMSSTSHAVTVPNAEKLVRAETSRAST